MSDPLSTFPKYVFEDLMKAIKEDSLHTVVRVSHRSPGKESFVMSPSQCLQSIHRDPF